MTRRQDAKLRVGELTAMANASLTRRPNDGADHRARDGQPYEVEGNPLHRISLHGRDRTGRIERQREED